MLTALTREISPSFADCQLTFVPRSPIDVEMARRQHADYEWALVEAGCTVRRIDADADMPDSVFIEDIAVVVDDLAVITRPGAASRRAETQGVLDALARLHNVHPRALAMVEPPATVDGGDVLIVGGRAFIGVSRRTNPEGATQMGNILRRVGYDLTVVPVNGCLHLKSAATAIGPEAVLINRDWVSADLFAGLELVDVDPAEPHAANALLVANHIVYPAAYPRTRDRLERRRSPVRPVDVSELAKAEGAVTCCSLVFEI